MPRRLALAFVILAGCAEAMTPPPTLPPPTGGTPRPREQVHVFMNRAPDRPHRLRGVYDSRRPSFGIDDPRTTLEETVALGAQAGCDGVLVNTGTLLFHGVAQDDEIGLIVTSSTDGIRFYGYRVGCIAFEAAPPPPPAPPSPPPTGVPVQ